MSQVLMPLIHPAALLSLCCRNADLDTVKLLFVKKLCVSKHMNEYASQKAIQYLKRTSSNHTARYMPNPNREFGLFDCAVVHTCSPAHGFVNLRMNLCVITCVCEVSTLLDHGGVS